MAGVRQDPQLFSESVQFNVDLDNPGIDAHRRQWAAEIVQPIGWSIVSAGGIRFVSAAPTCRSVRVSS